jgi:hypothetical protein
VVFVRNRNILQGTAPEVKKSFICCGEGPGPRGHPPGPVSFAVKDEDTGTQVVTTEFRATGMHCADTFMECPFPEKGAGNGFSVPLLLIIMEKIPFIRVNGNDTLLTIGVPYPEFKGTNVLLYADDLTHGAATVTAALACEGH